MAKNKSKLLGEFEIIIVGGGPAGTSTALHLLELDPALASRVLILEKSRHPREKICGGALTINAERVLEELRIPLTAPSAPVHHVRLVYGHAEIDLPESGCSKHVIRRCEFDEMLFKAVKSRGIETKEDIRVVKVIRQTDRLVLLTPDGHFHAQAVVSADGVNAVLRKAGKFGSGQMARLWVVESPVDPSSEPLFTEQVLLIDVSYVREGLRGYYWDFPCYIDGEPFMSRGMVDSNTNSATRVGSHEYLEGILARRGVSLEGARRKAFPFRHFDPREDFSRPRMLLAGDAVGSDALFSEGISQALEFGRLAAEELVEGFRRNDLSFTGYRKRVLSSRVGKELAFYRRLARLLYGPNVELLMSLLYENEELRELIGKSYAGTADMHRSKMRLLRMFTEHLLHVRRRRRAFRNVANIAPEGIAVRTAKKQPQALTCADARAD